MAAVVEGKRTSSAKKPAASKVSPDKKSLPAKQKAAAKSNNKSSAGKDVSKPKTAAKPRGVQLADWYDYPQYFDMVFRDETQMEVEFFEEAFKRFAIGSVKKVMEPGCGSGRLIAEMAARGYQCTGLDLSVPSLAYLRNRLKRRGLKADVLRADMTALDLRDDQGKRQMFDAAFCTFNTFRHLTTEDAAVSHLQTVADHLRPGGLYILGLHILPPDVEESCVERWTATHSQTKVHVTLRVIEFMRRKRLEQIRVTIKADKRAKRSSCGLSFRYGFIRHHRYLLRWLVFLILRSHRYMTSIMRSTIQWKWMRTQWTPSSFAKGRSAEESGRQEASEINAWVVSSPAKLRRRRAA